MFEIEDDQEHDPTCRQHHKSVDLSRVTTGQDLSRVVTGET